MIKILAVLTLLCASNVTYAEEPQQVSVLTPENFTRIKKFILEHGDKQTYCNKYGDNPHYKIGEDNFYLEPETGQQNINCDPKLSDFTELVIQIDRPNAGLQYLRVTHDKKKSVLQFKAAEKAELEKFFDAMLKVLNKKQ